MAGGGGKANKHHHDGAAIVPKYYTELLSSYLGQRYNNDQGAVGIVLATRLLQQYQYVLIFWGCVLLNNGRVKNNQFVLL